MSLTAFQRVRRMQQVEEMKPENIKTEEVKEENKTEEVAKEEKEIKPRRRR